MSPKLDLIVTNSANELFLNHELEYDEVYMSDFHELCHDESQTHSMGHELER